MFTIVGYQFSSVQLLIRVWLFENPWITACQASLSITNSWNSLNLTSIESMMSTSHLILYRPLLLLPPIPPSISVFFNESTLHMRWPKYWSFSFSISPSKEHPGLISFRKDWLDLPCSPRDSQESSPTPQFKSINSSALSVLHSPTRLITQQYHCWAYTPRKPEFLESTNLCVWHNTPKVYICNIEEKWEKNFWIRFS